MGQYAKLYPTIKAFFLRVGGVWIRRISQSYFTLKKVAVLNVSSGETSYDFMGCCWEHEEGDAERQTDRVMESRKRECKGGRHVMLPKVLSMSLIY